MLGHGASGFFCGLQSQVGNAIANKWQKRGVGGGFILGVFSMWLSTQLGDDAK